MGPRDGGTTSPALLNRLVDWRDAAAWNEFVDRYRPLIEDWCRRLRLDAETTDELCQRIWINLARRMSNFQYDPSRKFRGWLWRLCQSRAIDLFRERRADPIRLSQAGSAEAFRLSALSTDAEDEDPASNTTLVRIGEQVHESVKRQVARRTWDAFWSIAVEGLTVRETASALNMSYAAAFAAHKRVASRLRAEGGQLLSQLVASGVDTGNDDGI
jgi:RNA polymerase sigma-70 factor (ECF subfamily)